MSLDESRRVERFLQGEQIHRTWEANYRTRENEQFFDLLFSRLAPILAASRVEAVLDVGCGTAVHSIRLASLGFSVCGVDISHGVLVQAQQNVAAAGLSDRIRLQRQSALDLSFRDASFRAVFCWGILMHIPEVERALVELARVLRPGGVLIIGECNQNSIQARASRLARRWLARGRFARIEQHPAGIEHWKAQDGGMLLTREARITWLIQQLEKAGLVLQQRLAGQLTEIYTKLSSPALRALVHRVNNAWFRYVGRAGPAYGNVIVMGKPQKVGDGG